MRALAILAGLLLVCLPATAQVNTSVTTAPFDPTNPQSPQERDPSGVPTGGFSMTNIIHQANLANTRSPDQVRRDQNRSIDDAVNRFRSTGVRLTPQMINPPASTSESPTAKP